MRCPTCGLENLLTAMWCDCGYNFETRDLQGGPGSVQTQRCRPVMRETLGTLRLYFLLNGALGGLASVLLLIGVLAGPATARQVMHPATIFFLIAPALVGLGFAVAFVYVGFSLRRLLARSPKTIRSVLRANGGWVIVFLLLSLQGGVNGRVITTVGVSLLLIWYLLRNVNRLAAEAQNAAFQPASQSPNR